MKIAYKNLLEKLAGYSFDVEDRVRLKNTDSEGVILGRTFPFDKFTLQLLPGRYYNVMIQEKETFDGEKMYNVIKLSCRQGHLEKLNSDEGGKL